MVSGANTDYATITVAGTQLNRFIPKQSLTMAACNADETYVLALRAIDDSFPPSPDIGPHFRIAPDIEVAFSNNKIRVIVRARSSPVDGAAAFEANYFTGLEGGSGWQSFTLSDTYQDHAFDYTVPQAGEAQGVDFLGIRPIVDTAQTGIEIESVTFLNLAFLGP